MLLLLETSCIASAIFILSTSWSKSDKEVKTGMEHHYNVELAILQIQYRDSAMTSCVGSILTCSPYRNSNCYDFGALATLLIPQTSLTWLYWSPSEGFHYNFYKHCEEPMTYLDHQSSHQIKLDMLFWWNLEHWNDALLQYIHHICSRKCQGRCGNIYA